mmetsp:Transcript_7898/g.35857  ORF Transcript_7898/g.35857 Transcript_7898/m.35857 type:complete len:217 (+) Transcript_7898:5104-5754(+)
MTVGPLTCDPYGWGTSLRSKSSALIATWCFLTPGSLNAPATRVNTRIVALCTRGYLFGYPKYTKWSVFSSAMTLWTKSRPVSTFIFPLPALAISARPGVGCDWYLGCVRPCSLFTLIGARNSSILSSCSRWSSVGTSNREISSGQTFSIPCFLAHIRQFMFQSSSCTLRSYHALTSCDSNRASMSSHAFRAFLSSWIPDAEHTLPISSSTIVSSLP